MVRRHRSYFWLLVGTVATLLLVGLAFYRPFESEAQVVPVAEDPKQPPPAPLPGKRTTFLVMGVDRRGDDYGRSDSMMLIAYDEAKQQVSALSLPRDTWVEIPGHGYDKANHAYAFGGEGLARVTVERYLGIPIDHTVVVSFQGFAQIVDALGGIEIDVDKHMEYTDPYDISMGPEGLVIDIEPGLQHMDGITALKYARFRHDDEGDFGRMRRQQQVLKAAMQAASTPAVLGKIPKLATALQEALDTDLSVGEMVKLATGAKGALQNQPRTGSLTGDPRTIGGVYYLLPDLVAARTQAYETLVGDTAPPGFIQKAEAAQAVYDQVLSDAVAADEAAARQAAESEPADGAAGDPAGGVDGDGAGADDGTAGPTAGAGQAAPAPDSGSQGAPPAGESTTGGGTAKPQMVTVAVLDGSGGDLLSTYVPRLKEAGFRVARIGRLTRPVSQSVAVDHAGRPSLADRLGGVLPGILVVSAPDPSAGEAVEIILGKDLLSP